MGKGSGVVPAPTLLQAGLSAANMQTGEGRSNTEKGSSLHFPHRNVEQKLLP